MDSVRPISIWFGMWQHAFDTVPRNARGAGVDVERLFNYFQSALSQLVRRLGSGSFGADVGNQFRLHSLLTPLGDRILICSAPVYTQGLVDSQPLPSMTELLRDQHDVVGVVYSSLAVHPYRRRTLTIGIHGSGVR